MSLINRPPRPLTVVEAIDLFQSLEDEKTRLIWTLKVINLDLSQNLVLRMSRHCPNQELNVQIEDTTYATLNEIYLYSLFNYIYFDIQNYAFLF